MRQIKFRGKRVDNGEWVCGSLITVYYTKVNKLSECDTRIKLQDGYNTDCPEYNVDPARVSQFTGLLDKNGKEIWEGDILEFMGGTCDYLSLNHYGQKHSIGTILVVSNLNSGFTLQLPIHIGNTTPNLVGNISNYDFWNHQSSFKIIGNIHDNPSLLTNK